VRENDIDGFLAAYRNGATADFIQPRLNGRWGEAWAFAPCDPSAAERAGAQMVRMEATEARWFRRAKLKGRRGWAEVAIVTELPSKIQRVLEISTGVLVPVEAFLADSSTQSLLAAIRV